MNNEYKNFTDEELINAVELMVAKSDLKIREVAEALLKTFDYTESEIREQLKSGEYLNASEPLNLLGIVQRRVA